MNIMELMTVLGFGLTCISIGYSFGKDSKKKK